MRRAEAVQPNVAQGGLSPSNQYGRAIEQQPIDKVFLQKGGGCLCAPLDHQEISLGKGGNVVWRSEEHTSELQSLMRRLYAVFCLKKKTVNTNSLTSTNIPHSEHITPTTNQTIQA